MTQEKQEEAGGKLLPFPAARDGADPEGKRREMMQAVIAELVKPLRESETRQQIRNRLGTSDEAIEEILRSPELRRQLAACVEAYAMEQLPRAIKGFYEVLGEKESWAYKILLDAIGFQELLRGYLVTDVPATAGPVISEGFEQDVVSNVLAMLRGEDGKTTQDE